MATIMKQTVGKEFGSALAGGDAAVTTSPHHGASRETRSTEAGHQAVPSGDVEQPHAGGKEHEADEEVVPTRGADPSR